MVDVEHLHEKLLASALLIEVAGRSSANVDRFSGWILAGYAGALTLLLANSETVLPLFSDNPLPSAISVLVAVLALAIVQKVIAVVISGAAAAAPLGRELAASYEARGIELDLNAFFKEMERAMIPPMRWLVARSFRKAQSGDLVASSRNFSRFGQVQALVVLAQTVLVLVQIWCVAQSVAL